jgi:O-antigen biosynthesis protein
MRLSLCIPIMGQLDDTKGMWGCHVANIADKANIELIVIDNGSTDGSGEFIERIIFPHYPHHRMIRHDDNTGVIASMNEAVRESTGDVVAILHNDLYVYEHGWDQRVLAEFDADPRLGMVGFLGSEGIAANGGRFNVWSNMLEAEVHGGRDSGSRAVAVFDGMSLIGRRTMFEQVGGFDTNFTYHHMYDKSISLESRLAGWTNKMIGVFCHHRSGVTANRPDYQNWISQKLGTEPGKGDQTSYQQSEAYFLQKYAAHLPIDVRR